MPLTTVKGAVLNRGVNVMDFGAVGDGVTDDSNAVSLWLDYLLLVEGQGLVPEGQYLLSSQVAKTVTNANLTIRGEGVSISRFIVDNANGGIAINATDRESEIVIQGVEFIAARTPSLSSGVGLAITMPEGGNRHNRSITMRDVKFSVINENDITTYGYWDTACDLTGCWRPLLDGVVVSGAFGPGISDDLSDTSPLYKTAVGLDLDGCYGVEIDNCYVWSCATGITSSATGDPGPEGFRMSNTNIVEVKNALQFSRLNPEPTVWIDTCHYNYRDRGLSIDGAKLVNIKSCVPYNVDVTPEFIGTPVDVYLDNTEKVIISKNTFHFDGNANRKNISIVASTLADSILIEGNIFNATAAEGIEIGSSATNVFILNNEFPGSVTTEVDDKSNSATILQRDGNAKMRLESGAASASAGPECVLYRNSESPAALDNMGQHSFDGNNSVGTRTTYSAIKCVAQDVTNGTEDGKLQIFNRISGSLLQVAELRDANSANDTSMFLLVNDGTTTTVRRVTVGAANSAGAGYRELRVTN